MKIAALILAAGSGTRAGGKTPKQYQPILGEPVLRHTLRAFCQHADVSMVQAVIAENAFDLYAQAAAGLPTLKPVIGGDTRQASVLRGLKALAAYGPDVVLIHDGARACVDESTISRVIVALHDAKGAIAALPVSDTLKSDAAGFAVTGPARDELWRAQTPQGFRFDGILAAYETATETYTDDAAVAEAAGLEVRLVRGSEDNTKITYEEDFTRAAVILAGRKGAHMMETRTGYGADVHRFGAGDHVWLCGIAIPHSHALAGHSDADVALHALTDAVLGAIGAEDIGAHFPPSDPTWAGASSDRFLHHATEMARKQGGRITHLDVTIICEAPKVGPHREVMRARIAEICELDLARVSVKATTTEKLGFTGRGEGIEARAVATIELPRS
jgi:2-C-methyl-D-erythritol 4-phosphate cytidylyltransferase/2-C-methyl-D-erythritol 2,4-cyclodiphosphate synthase